jgi:DsbC/DsbD-like thiol-disulfide interchange protein
MPVFSLASGWLVLLLVLGALPALAQEDAGTYSDVELVSDRAAVRSGETFDVALRITMDPGWHNYWLNPGDAGMPTHIEWELPDGVTAGEIRWPYPQWIEVPPYASYAYKDEVLLLTQITVAEGFSASTLDLRAEAEWLVCEEVCYAGNKTVALSLPLRDAPAAAEDAGLMARRPDAHRPPII